MLGGKFVNVYMLLIIIIGVCLNTFPAVVNRNRRKNKLAFLSHWFLHNFLLKYVKI